MIRFFAFVLLFVLAVPARAEDQQWTLSDGTTVTVVKVLSQNATHVTIRSAEGIRQIDKRRLPEELKSLYPYDEAAAAAQAEAADAERARLAQSAETRAPAAAAGARHPASQGGETLEILSVRPSGRATATVTMVNRSGALQEISRDLLVGVNVNGTAFRVSRFTNERGDVLTKVRLLPDATKDILIVFDIPEGEVGDIANVYWNRR
ncbi:MAG TPA: hypothetical protein VK178_03380 [Opitutaceae bacterium]|nr:hypothetical protein [Opitutaceae bacterium]